MYLKILIIEIQMFEYFDSSNIFVNEYSNSKIDNLSSFNKNAEKIWSRKMPLCMHSQI